MTDLVILGNGFDIALGLKTKYAQFFKDRNEKTGAFREIVKKAVFEGKPVDIIGCNSQIRDITYWDIIFCFAEFFNNETSEWNNIEKIIEKVITNENNLVADNQTFILEIFPDARMYFYNDEEGEKHYRCASILEIYLEKELNVKASSLYFPYLLKELKRFELFFAEYIREISNVGDYNEHKERELMKAILEINPYQPRKIEKIRLLSFNYTSKVFGLKFEEECLFKYRENAVHIHGLAESDYVIFGFDEVRNSLSKTDQLSTKYSFTKTARLLDSKHVPTLANIFDTHEQTTIRFFGHSLSEFDYSYFQSIFDYYEIYDSNHIIKFFYTNYDEKNVDVVRERYISSVVNLMKAYGITMNNKDHGNNLLHKLLLESRLKVIEI